MDVHLQLLAINDYHGHLEVTTPGSVAGAAAGGAEYLSAKLNELRAGPTNSLTVAAGDLIGGSPAFSGLFHDEPSVESLNVMQLDVSSVGSHGFDEGVTELLRMHNDGGSGDCAAVTVSNVELNGVPLEDATSYSVTVNSFLADGGDNFGTFATVAGPRPDGGVDLQALTSYLAAFGPVAPPSTDRVNELP
jgi:2',3'-cyclic-nucleotide 2'-phosphodiesterase (5'-nucleotidase family)